MRHAGGEPFRLLRLASGRTQRPQVADAALLADVQTIHVQHQKRYGAPRIRQELKKRGQRHGTKRIARLMRADRLRGRCARRCVPRTTDSDHESAHRLQPPGPGARAQRSQPDLGE